MFKDVDEVKSANTSDIISIVEKSWKATLKDILTEEDIETLSKAKMIEGKAEKIAFAIRDRFNEIIKNGVEENEDYDEDEEYENIDEFMNSIASSLGQHYNGEYEHRPDYFWIPSTCY